jgi:hypothetical protein
MRNRAKCKKCSDIIESFHRNDYVLCSCGEIAVEGGNDFFKVMAKDFSNFIRLDDDDKEIPIKVIEKPSLNPIPEMPNPDVKPLDNPILTKKDKLDALDEMIKSYEGLPEHAKSQPCTHYDVLSVLLLLRSLSEE